MQSEPTATDPALFVPDEPGVYWCAKHRKVKTRLRCGRCERPICPKCTVYGPTGARCPDCASNRSSHIYQVKPWQYLLSFLAAAVFGALGSVLVGLAGIILLFWALMYAPAVGETIGKTIAKFTGGKRGPVLASVISVGLVCGSGFEFVGRAIATQQFEKQELARMTPQQIAQLPPYMVDHSFLASLVANPFGLLSVIVFLALTIGAVWRWIR